MTLLRDTDLCSTCLTIANKRKMKGFIGLLQIFAFFPKLRIHYGWCDSQDKIECIVNQEKPIIIFGRTTKNLPKVYSHCCKSYTIKVMWLYSSLPKSKSSDARVNAQKINCKVYLCSWTWETVLAEIQAETIKKGRKHALRSFTMLWKYLLNEISPTEKDKYYIISLIYGI